MYGSPTVLRIVYLSRKIPSTAEILSGEPNSRVKVPKTIKKHQVTLKVRQGVHKAYSCSKGMTSETYLMGMRLDLLHTLGIPETCSAVSD